jgi:6-phosphofructokinase 1
MVLTFRLTCAHSCLLVMGRSAGFIAAHATMASSDIDLCLIPEVAIVLEGEDGCLPHLMRRVKEQGYAVVVVAEGAGEDVLGISAEVDAGGNRKLPAIGEFMKKQVEDYFVKHGDVATVKYIDPSYTIRSVPANAADSLCKHHTRRYIAMSHAECSWSTIFSRYSLSLADIN